MPELKRHRSGTMRQQVLEHPGAELRIIESEIPQPGPGQVLLEVSACAVCDMDLQIQMGLMHGGQFPLVPGHEIVGRVLSVGSGVTFTRGQRLGLAWLGRACGDCWYCDNDLDHLCDKQQFTGLHLNGGYASHVLAEARHCYSMDTVRAGRSPDSVQDTGFWSEEAAMAPLLCEGSLAYRSYKPCRQAARIGLYGFGTAAQLICQMATAEGHEVYAMTRPGGEPLLELAQTLGAHWTGTLEQMPPVPLDAAILMQPTVELVPHALSAVRRNGTLVFLGMHASRVPAFPYDLFMDEHSIHSVSRSSRADMTQFLELCSKTALKTRIRTYSLAEANLALHDSRSGLHGEAVLVMRDGAG